VGYKSSTLKTTEINQRVSKRGEASLTNSFPLSFQGEGDTGGEVDKNIIYYQKGDLNDSRPDTQEQELSAILSGDSYRDCDIKGAC